MSAGKPRERIAAILGHRLGPISDGGRWNPHYVPRWPEDYTTQERRVLLDAADAVLADLDVSRGGGG